MLFSQDMFVDLITFVGLTILYFAYDLYVNRFQPARSRPQRATREQRTPATVLRFVAGPIRGMRHPAFETRNTARRRVAARALGRRGSAHRPHRVCGARLTLA